MIDQDSIRDANDRKAEGNDCFRESKWNEALVAYQAGLNRLPKRMPAIDEDRPNSPTNDVDEHDPVAEAKTGSRAKDEEHIPASEEGVVEEDAEVVQLRSVLSSNIGACHVKLVS